MERQRIINMLLATKAIAIIFIVCVIVLIVISVLIALE